MQIGAAQVGLAVVFPKCPCLPAFGGYQGEEPRLFRAIAQRRAAGEAGAVSEKYGASTLTAVSTNRLAHGDVSESRNGGGGGQSGLSMKCPIMTSPTAKPEL